MLLLPGRYRPGGSSNEYCFNCPELQKGYRLVAGVRRCAGGLRAAFEFRNASSVRRRSIYLLNGKHRPSSTKAPTAKISGEWQRRTTAIFVYHKITLAGAMERWAKTITDNEKVWPDVFVYLKHKESCTSAQAGDTG
jgi:hypothetical protein